MEFQPVVGSALTVLLEDNGSEVVVYVFGDDLLAQDRADDFRFYHYDGLGSTRSLSDGSGAVTDTYAYTAFGEELSFSGSSENAYLYTGEQMDAETGNYYLRARYLNTGVGRFTQQDTYMGRMGEPVTLHKYLYGNADPVMYTDPSGYASFSSVLTTVNIMTSLASSAGVGYSIGTFFVSDESIKDRAKTLAQDALLSLMPAGAFKTFLKFKGLKVVDVQSNVVYRYMTKAELEAVRQFNRLRGNRSGPTYFSTDKYKSAKQAKSKLALDDADVPEVRVQVRVKNNPRTVRRDKVQSTKQEKGGGVEYFTSDPVYVDILEVSELK